MSHQAKSPQDYRIVLQQDACEPILHVSGRISEEALIQKSVKQLEGYRIDMYASDANHAPGVHYKSSVAELFLQHAGALKSGSALRVQRALRQLIEKGTDPLKIYSKAAHAQGMDYMVRLRMNDLHDLVGFRLEAMSKTHVPRTHVAEPYYHTSQWRREHPQFLLGDPHDQTPEGTFDYWQRGAANYALAPVRQYMAGMAEELVKNYDLDVLELDFIRSPFFFARAERYAQRHVMTALVRQIAEHCRDAGATRKRPVRLSVRVADSIEQSLQCGLDLPRWLGDRLLDMVTIGGGYSPFATAWQDIVTVAQKAGVPALACLSHSRLADKCKQIRAAASRAFDHGVSGFELFNFFYCMDCYHRSGANPMNLAFAAEIADQGRLAPLAKTYTASRMLDSSDYVMSAYEHVSAPGQLPLTIGRGVDGVGQIVALEIADDTSNGPWTLVVEVLDLGPDDQLAFAWNGQQIEPRGQARAPIKTHDRQLFEFSLPANSCRRGSNALGVKLLAREAGLSPFITVTDVQVNVPGREELDK